MELMTQKQENLLSPWDAIFVDVQGAYGMHQEDAQRFLWVRMRVLRLYVTLCTVLL